VTTSIINAARARINGLEVEVSISPIKQLTLSGYYGLTDAKYLDFTQRTSAGAIQDLSANKFAGVPRNTAGGSVRWDIVESSALGDLQFNADVRYSDGFQLQPLNLAGAYIESFDVWNASLRLEKAFGTRMSLELFAKNLFDKSYGSGGFSSTALGFAVKTLGEPRVVGVGLRIPFGDE